MKTLAATLLSTAALLAAAGSTARAADMLPVDYPPIYSEVPEVVPVEIGNGWYLRGDVSYDFETDIEGRHREYRPDFETFGHPTVYDAGMFAAFDGGGQSWTLDSGASVGVGVGYQFTDMLRGDVTASYWEHDLSRGSSRLDSCYAYAESLAAHDGWVFEAADLDCASSGSGKVEAWELMANAYVDLGTVSGFTPYLGAGAGGVRLEYDVETGNSCAYEGVDCIHYIRGAKVEHETIDDWRFAYSLMAGVAYDVNQALKIDLGYRYLNVGEGDMFGFSEEAKALGASGAQNTDEGFDRHTVQAGIRYSLF